MVSNSVNRWKIPSIWVKMRILKNITQTQSIDYFLRFLSNIEKPMTITDGIFLPFECLEIVQKKINSTTNMYNNINHAVLFTRRSK